MARTATLLELRTRSYQRGGFESATDRFPAAEVNGLINESIADLYDQILRARGFDSFETASSFTTTAGTSIYTLGAPFYELLAVSIDAGSGAVPVERFMTKERPWLTSGSDGCGNAFMYKLVGGNLELLPTPAAVYTVEFRYVPAASLLTVDGDTFDGINGWEEWVVVDVARKMATKERDFELVGVLNADLQRLASRIRELAGARDRASNRRPVDVRGRSFRPWRTR